MHVFNCDVAFTVQSPEEFAEPIQNKIVLQVNKEVLQFSEIFMLFILTFWTHNSTKVF